jgi:hypothetical protein
VLWVQSSESGEDHKIQSILSRIGLFQHGHQEFGDGRAAFSVLESSRIIGELALRNRTRAAKVTMAFCRFRFNFVTLVTD